eukprot:9000565-Pyramimonas_sp.AAC.1
MVWEAWHELPPKLFSLSLSLLRRLQGAPRWRLKRQAPAGFRGRAGNAVQQHKPPRSRRSTM